MERIFGRLMTAMVTPFKPDGQVDYTKAAQLAEYLVDQGSQGLVVTGTTGESPSLKEAEKLKLYRVIKEKTGSRAKVLAGTGSNCTGDSVELSRKAAAVGVDGLMLVTPYYNKPSQEGLMEHFRVIAAAVPELPVMLYNVPSRKGVNLEVETVVELSRVPNIVALKEAGGNLQQIAGIIQGAEKGFAVYSGNDDETLAILALGGAGVVSVCSHVAGSQIARMMELYFSGRREEAFALNRRLMPLFKGLFMATNPLPVKAALRMLGMDTGGHRLPLTALDPVKEKALQNLLKESGFIRCRDAGQRRAAI
jgi:4-hydroxy-tetrahydrodipicolinate synthase